MNVKEESVLSAKLTIAPKETLLQTYNVLSLKDPNNILDFLVNPLAAPLTENMVNDDTGIKEVKANYKQEQSLESVRQQFASSVGLSADFAAFSASVQNNFETDTQRTVTNFDASCHLSIDFGSASIRFNDREQILGLMNDTFKSKLSSINSLGDAARFVESYGTHVITAVGLGGNLCIAIHADSTDLKTKREISTEVDAAFSGMENSVSSVVKAVNKTATEHKDAHVTIKLVAIGGDPRLVDPFGPESISNWDATCDANSIRNVSRSIPIWELANTNASSWLERYIYYKMLEVSLAKPRIFSSLSPIDGSPFTHACAANSGFRIIAGGAMVNMHSDNYLINSHPQLDNDGNIQSWGGMSNNMHGNYHYDRDYLAVYAMSIFDPKNLLDIKVDTKRGSNNSRGTDTAKAVLRDFYTLTGGGTYTETRSGGNKYIVASYPGDDNRSWNSEVCDFDNYAEDVELTTYVIGVNDSRNNLSVDSHTVAISSPSAVEHGDETAGGNNHLCSGGVKVERRDGTLNIVQATYPKRSNAWREYNKDLGGKVTYAVSTAYANWLEAYLEVH